ncbi:MAG: hypothetical protein Q8N98_00380 [bacterium]|nr:hypothetical protein [bacterium]
MTQAENQRRRRDLRYRRSPVVERLKQEETPAQVRRWWLGELGFRQDPFSSGAVVAETDTLLSQTFTEDKLTFAALLDPYSSALCAPSGWGKTAYRLELAKTMATDHLMIDYNLRPLVSHLPEVSLEDHLNHLLSSAGTALLRHCFTKPGFFEGLDGENQGLIASFLDRFSPDWPQQLRWMDGLETAINDPAAKDLIQTLQEQGPRLPQDLLPCVSYLRQIAGDSGFQGIRVMVDGVDGCAETHRNPAAMEKLLGNLWNTLDLFRFPGLAFKFFLPEEMTESLLSSNGVGSRLITPVKAPRLTEYQLEALLSTRCSFASGGLYPSFDALCDESCYRDGRRLVWGVMARENTSRALLIAGDEIFRAHTIHLLDLPLEEQRKSTLLSREDMENGLRAFDQRFPRPDTLPGQSSLPKQP